MIKKFFEIVAFLVFFLATLTGCRYLERYNASYGVEILPCKELRECVVYLDEGFLMGPMHVGKGQGTTYSEIERSRPEFIRLEWKDSKGDLVKLEIDMRGKYPDEWKVKGDVIVVIINEDNSYDLEFVVFEGEWNELKIKRFPPKDQQ